MSWINLYQTHGFYLLPHRAPPYAKRYLRYETSSGASQEVEVSSEQFDQLITRLTGHYFKLDQDYFGLYPSFKGPVLFQNNQRFDLADDEVHLHLIQLTESYSHTFVLYKGESQIINVSYARIPEYLLGAQLFDFVDFTEEDADFFLWITNKLTNEREPFFQQYTLKE